MARPGKPVSKWQTRGFSSIKDGQSANQKSKKLVHKHTNLGTLMRKHGDLDELLFSFSTVSDFIHEDMDFTVEEFCDWTGADMDELIEEIIRLITKR